VFLANSTVHLGELAGGPSKGQFDKRGDRFKTRLPHGLRFQHPAFERVIVQAQRLGYRTDSVGSS